MKAHKIIALLLLLALLQTLLPAIIPGYGWLKVEWGLLAVVFISLKTSLYSSMRFGVCAGLLVDIFSGSRLGIYGLSYMIAALCIGSTQPWMDQDNLPGACITAFCASVIVGTVNYFLLDMFGSYPGYFSYILWLRILPQAVINTILAAPMYLFLNRAKPIRQKYCGI